MSDARPPGWTLNPSSWSQRWPLIFWAMAGFFIPGYLSLYQWRIIDNVWEPFFGDGSRRVLDSQVSHILPIPDAALGALGYLFDAVTAVVGGRRRWKTMPGMVVLFGFAAGPMGLVGVLLVILQPVFVGGWCTLCLASAVISVGLISPSLDEVLACLQHLRRERDAGRSVWRAFWRTRDREAAAPPERRPETEGAFTWPPAVCAALGLWIMAAPAVLGYGGAGRTNDWVFGPIVATFGVMALWEFMRPVRWVNAVLGGWFALAAFFLQAEEAGRWNSMICGILNFLLSVKRDVHRPELFGGGWSAAWKKSTSS